MASRRNAVDIITSRDRFRRELIFLPLVVVKNRIKRDSRESANVRLVKNNIKKKKNERYDDNKGRKPGALYPRTNAIVAVGCYLTLRPPRICTRVFRRRGRGGGSGGNIFWAAQSSSTGFDGRQ